MSLITTYSWARPKVWNTGGAAERFRHNLKLKLKNKNKKKKQASNKRALTSKHT